MKFEIGNMPVTEEDIEDALLAYSPAFAKK
jgi:hypothetical protein